RRKHAMKRDTETGRWGDAGSAGGPRTPFGGSSKAISASPCPRIPASSLPPRLRAPASPRPSSGMALVIILGVLVMVTVLVVALLTLAAGERSASSLSLHRTQAEIFADAAADRAMASIDAAIAEGSGAGKSWASEPGRI